MAILFAGSWNADATVFFSPSNAVFILFQIDLSTIGHKFIRNYGIHECKWTTAFPQIHMVLWTSAYGLVYMEIAY